MAPKEPRARRTRSRASPPVTGSAAVQAIDAMVRDTPDWRGATLAALRATILAADPGMVEEVKWKMRSNPDGVPVWSHNGIVCIANVLKAAVRLTFTNGPEIKDPKKLFNARLDSKVVRAIDVHEGEKWNEEALKALVRDAVRLRTSTPESA